MKDETRVLAAARDLLMREGWIRLSARTAAGGCAAAAISDAAEKLHLSAGGPKRQLTIVVAQDFGAAHILGWNDTPGRTFYEVLSAFDKAIKASEEEDAP